MLRREITTPWRRRRRGSVVEWLYANHGVHPDDIVNEKCDGGWDDDLCWYDAVRELAELLHAVANPMTQCAVELTREYAEHLEQQGPTDWSASYYFPLDEMPRFAMQHRCDYDAYERRSMSQTLRRSDRKKAVECCRVFEAEADRLGMLPPN